GVDHAARAVRRGGPVVTGGDRRGRNGVLAPGVVPGARRRHAPPPLQRARDRHLGAADQGRHLGRAGLRRRPGRARRPLAGAGDPPLLAPHAEAPRPLGPHAGGPRHAGQLLRRHPGRAGAGRRPVVHARRRLRGRRRRPPPGRAGPDRRQRRLVRHVERPHPAAEPLLRPRRGAGGRPGVARQAPAGRGGRRPRAGDVHARRHRLGGRDPPLPRGAGVVLARRPHRARGELPFRGARDARNQDLRPADRLAELDLPAPQRLGTRRRAPPLRHRIAPVLRPKEGLIPMTAPATIDYTEKIPNNVDLASDRRLQRALESWQPKFLQWWRDLGPVAFQDHDVYLRTAISTDQEGWANFDFVKMPEYRWGIFLAPQEADRTIAFGDHMGDPVWQDVPGEYRADLRRLIVVQGDTEPASVEQQRHLCNTAPSLWDLRNLFQVNVEEGRHLWAMVYLLHRYFG